MTTTTTTKVPTLAAATAAILAIFDADAEARAARLFADRKAQDYRARLAAAATIAAYCDANGRGGQAAIAAVLVTERNVSRSGAASSVSRLVAVGHVVAVHADIDTTEVAALVHTADRTKGASASALVAVMCGAKSADAALRAGERYLKDAAKAAETPAPEATEPEATEPEGTDTEGTPEAPARASMHDLVVAMSGPIAAAMRLALSDDATDDEVRELLDALHGHTRRVLSVATRRGIVKAA